MNRTNVSLARALLRAARPWSLFGGILLYALGGGIATYLGYPIDGPVYWIGQAGITLLQLSSNFLREYFDRAGQPPFETRPARRVQRPPANITPDGENPEAATPDSTVPRGVFFQVAAATLTVGAVTTVLLIAENKMSPVVSLFYGLAFLLAIAYAVPPFRLVNSGYGELVLAILNANLFPTIAFLLQSGELHRLLAMISFPLTLLYLAALLAISLQSYYRDTQENRSTMLTRLGWQRGMTLHNALIAMAYIVLAVSVISGLPWRLAFPGFLSMPVAVFQVWQMNSIANGGKPHWRLLTFTALALVGFTVYFINLALWIG
ncbi:MAG: prenyltransferase [Chloroflexi bacterium]|nr:MAG: prenyltransferase [Chloroflexota bacterium]